MKLSEIKSILKTQEKIAFKLPDGSFVPAHFHVTEIGKVSKHFIDCGGTVRHEDCVNFQLWSADDYDHRLHPDKLLNIISLSEEKLQIEDHDIEVEYQGETIGKFGLEFDGEHFLLTNKQTDCLAKDVCVPPVKEEKAFPILTNAKLCSPDGNCC